MNVVENMIKTANNNIKILNENTYLLEEKNILKIMKTRMIKNYMNYIRFFLGNDAVENFLAELQKVILASLKNNRKFPEYSFIATNDNKILITSSERPLVVFDYIENYAYPYVNEKLEEYKTEVILLEEKIKNLDNEIAAMKLTLDQFYNLINTKNISKKKLQQLKEKKKNIEEDVIYKKSEITIMEYNSKPDELYQKKMLYNLKNHYGVNIKEGALPREFDQ